MSITTKTGDEGYTDIAGKRLRKDHPLLECLGTLDELNAFLGDAKTALDVCPSGSSISGIISSVQEDLSSIMGYLAAASAEDPEISVYAQRSGGSPERSGGSPARPGGPPERPGCSPERPGGPPVRPGCSPIGPGCSPVRPGGSPVRPGGSPMRPGNFPEGVNEARLTSLIAEIEASLPPITSFAVPGENPASAKLHIARTVCRRAERRLTALDGAAKAVLPYINRLSDLLFLLAHKANMI